MIASIRTYARAFLRLFRVLAPVRRAATAALPTEYGEFTIHVYQTRFTRGTHVALVCGESGSGHNVRRALVSASASSRRCLQTKKDKLGHVLSSISQCPGRHTRSCEVSGGRVGMSLCTSWSRSYVHW